jgi:energy-coupling factor transporter ATP-binding protein EcfA2
VSLDVMRGETVGIVGKKGSGKSTGARVLRTLVDPNLAPLRSEPKEARDLAITANNSWVVAFDNLSALPSWLSDAMCRLATGGGFATRALYTNDEETIFDAQRPSIVTAIGDVIARSDLLDRAVTVTPVAIEAAARKSERQFWQEFAAAQPKILGAMFDIVASGLGRLPSVQIQNLPRMADFAQWATACEPAMGLPAGTFMSSCRRQPPSRSRST